MCQKDKIASVLGNGFSMEKNENENMIDNGYNRIYDCGSAIYAYDGRKNR